MPSCHNNFCFSTRAFVLHSSREPILRVFLVRLHCIGMMLSYGRRDPARRFKNLLARTGLADRWISRSLREIILEEWHPLLLGSLTLAFDQVVLLGGYKTWTGWGSWGSVLYKDRVDRDIYYLAMSA